MDEKFKTTSALGIIPLDKKKFNHCKLFKEQLWKNEILKKVKLWWGTPENKDNNNEEKTLLKNKNINEEKTLLGIQCTYKNILTGKETITDLCCGKLISNDIIVEELSVKDEDYFKNFKLGFNLSNITYIEFITKKGHSIKFGNDIPKTIDLNKEDNVIQSFFGFYNDSCITALGCKYINRKYFILITLMNILRLRHFFNTNKEEKNKWMDNNNLKNLELITRAIAKICLLPNSQFFGIIKYLI